MQIDTDTDLAELSEGDEIAFTTETGALGIAVDVTARVTDVSIRQGDVSGPFQKTVVTAVGNDEKHYELTRTVTETYTSDIGVTRENPFHPADQNCGTVTEASP